MMMILHFLLLIINCSTGICSICTDMVTMVPKNDFQKFRLLGSTYVAMVSNTDLNCAAMCLYDILCASFNYHTDTRTCELNFQTVSSTPGQVVNTPGWTHVTANSIPQQLIGACAMHTCPRGSVCVAGSPTESHCLPGDRCMTAGSTPVYRGYHNITLSGIPCQRWESHYPHLHPDVAFSSDTLASVDTLEQAGNRCLLEFDDTVPWCYTTDPGVRWEYCSIPVC